jgi:hypothetical protein
MAYMSTAMREASEKPFDVYRRLDLGEGGHSAADGKDAKAAVVDIIKRKHKR